MHALAVAAACIAIVGACTDERPGARKPSQQPEAAAVATLVDAEGRVPDVAAPAARVISLVPAATEIIERLGAGRLLVGRTDFDSQPSLAAVPSVGGGLSPSIERILALEPDLVIRFAAATDRATASNLDAHAVRHFAIKPERIEDIRTIVRALGMLLARQQAADSLIHEMDSAIAAVRQAVAGRPRPRVAYVIGGEPPRVAGPGTFIDELINIAGGTNVFGDVELPYPAISTEELLVRQPDFIVAPQEAVVASPARGRVARVSSDLFHRPTPDLASAARQLARILHPQAFP
ncbi:MAG: ABC transporter substrate-binding protein [Gemmatimonadetes bacterium]|nr:ABC transporter substrate-binding protein [Gemmatimonadota bacterium]